jgi:lipid A 3-O-deacylase
MNMFSKALITLFVTLLATTSQYTHATSEHGYAIDFLNGSGGVTGLKLAYQYHPQSLQGLIGDSRFYFESSANLWRYQHADDSQSNAVLAISPVLQFPAFSISHTPIYVEAGIGISLVDETHFAGKNISTHYQFEDRVGLVADFGTTNVAVRVIHYSNAGFKSPNPGLDFITLSMARRF